mgnify:CR=1 FL=1
MFHSLLRSFRTLRHHWRHPAAGRMSGLDILRYIGPGLLVTMGFIDPGNWAGNLAAGADFGYSLLWVVTLSTLMLILLQHNVAHLALSPDCAFPRLPPVICPVAVAPALVERHGRIGVHLAGRGAGQCRGPQHAFGIPLVAGAALTVVMVVALLFSGTYRAWSA